MFFISVGKEFHSRGAVLSPYRLRDGGTYMSLFEVEGNTLAALCSRVGQCCNITPVVVVHETVVAGLSTERVVSRKASAVS